MSSSSSKTSGDIRSCEKECLDPCEGKLTGNIPYWLQGSLLRNGPGLFTVGDTSYEHFFDGLALLHQFEISPGGKVTYRNRFLDSDTYRKNKKANRIIVSEFGTYGYPDPCATLFERFKSSFSMTKDMTDNANINVMKIGDGFYVATETNFIRRIDPKTLETKEKVDLTSLVSVNTSTAHPHYGSDGAFLNVGSSFMGRPSYVFVNFPSEKEESLKKGSVICRVPSTRLLYPSYYHSFGMTDNYLILVEQSLVVSLPHIIWGTMARSSFRDSLKWMPDQLTRFQIVNRSTGEHLKTNLVTGPIMVFHHANAFESDDGQEIVLDVCAYEDDGIVKATTLEQMFGENVATDGVETQKKPHPFQRIFKNVDNKTLRFVLPLKEATEEQVKSRSNLVNLEGSLASAFALRDGSIFCEPDYLSKGLSAMEMPQINYSTYNGKKYRYLYGVGKERDGNKSGLVKLNVEERSHLMWSCESLCPSEPVFVPKPKAAREDDGVLLSSLLDENDGKKVILLVLDATNMKELARVEFQTPGTIPGDLHGNFYKT